MRLRVIVGKSSIFQAVLNHMHVESGEVHVGGTMAYVPQTPWVQNLTLRDNILFGLPYDEAKYKEVRASAYPLPPASFTHLLATCTPAILARLCAHRQVPGILRYADSEVIMVLLWAWWWLPLTR